MSYCEKNKYRKQRKRTIDVTCRVCISCLEMLRSTHFCELLYPEDGSTMMLRKVANRNLIYTACHPRRITFNNFFSPPYPYILFQISSVFVITLIALFPPPFFFFLTFFYSLSSFFPLSYAILSFSVFPVFRIFLCYL